MDTPFNVLTNSPWVFWFLKLLTLAFLYWFIYRVMAMVIRDIRFRTAAEGDKNRGGYEGTSPTDVYALVVAESNIEAIKPGTRYPLKRDVTVGRGANNSIRINDSFVSHEHARIFCRDGEFLVEDLHSRNGTLVDGNNISKPVLLNEGAFLQIGGVTFKMVRWENEGG